MIGKTEVEIAADLLAGHVRRTPIIALGGNSLGINESVSLKLENLQHTGSFKPRGVFNRILSSNARPESIVVASGGNAGLAVAYVANQIGVPAEVFVPTTASPVKIKHLHELGANVTIVGANYSEAYAASTERASDPGVLVVHAYDQPEMAAGNGTVALEIEEQLGGDVDTVVVAVGGGGLFTGIAAWFSDTVRIVAVEPERCATLSAAVAEGRLLDITVGGVAADSLGATRVSEMALDAAQRCNVQSVLVTEEAIVSTRSGLWHTMRLATEPGGATALAALASGAYKPEPDERVAVIVCGANTDLSTLRS